MGSTWLVDSLVAVGTWVASGVDVDAKVGGCVVAVDVLMGMALGIKVEVGRLVGALVAMAVEVGVLVVVVLVGVGVTVAASSETMI